MAILSHNRPQDQRIVRVLSPAPNGRYESPDGRVLVTPRRRTPPTTTPACTPPAQQDPPSTEPRLEIRNWDLWKATLDQIRTAHDIECQPQAEFEAAMTAKLSRNCDNEWTYVQQGANSKLVVTMTNESSPSERQFIILACAHIAPRKSTVATLTTLAHNAHTSCEPWRPFYPRTKQMKACCNNLYKDVPENSPLSRPDKRLKQIEKGRQANQANARRTTESVQPARNTQQQASDNYANQLNQLESYTQPDTGFIQDQSGQFHGVNGAILERNEFIHNNNKIVHKNNQLVMVNIELNFRANDLELKCNDIMLKHNALNLRYNDLEAKFNELGANYHDLTLKCNALELKNSDHAVRNNGLSLENQELRNQLAHMQGKLQRVARELMGDEGVTEHTDPANGRREAQEAN